MLGAIIGDIVGSRFEFNNTNDKNFKFFSPDCDITDDTICTIAMADAILNKENYAAALMRWCEKYPHPMGGYGISFAKWVKNRNINAPYGSYGNGAAMRISAIGGAFETEHETIREAYKATHITHSHVEGIIGATCIARIIYRYKNDFPQALQTNALNEIATDYYGFQWNSKANLPSQGEWNETCQGCVPLALDIVAKSNSFSEAIRSAILYGGDSDTLGAIAGAVAEERFGIEQNILQEASPFVPQEIKEIIFEFYKKYYSKKRNEEIALFFEC